MKNSFFSRFTPKEPKFFPLLKQLSEVLCEASVVLIESLQHDSPTERSDYYKKIKDLEREGDRLTHLIFDELGTIFFLFEKFGDKEFVYIIRLVLDFMQFGTVFTEKSRFLTECFEFVHGFAYIDRFLLNQTAQLFAIL